VGASVHFFKNTINIQTWWFMRTRGRGEIISKAEATKKRTGPPTIDDVLEDITSKINLIKEAFPAETCRRMIDTISKDSSLTESDKTLLTEKVRELAGSS
jgi:hypothetical protein